MCVSRKRACSYLKYSLEFDLNELHFAHIIRAVPSVRQEYPPVLYKHTHINTQTYETACANTIANMVYVACTSPMLERFVRELFYHVVNC